MGEKFNIAKDWATPEFGPAPYMISNENKIN